MVRVPQEIPIGFISSFIITHRVLDLVHIVTFSPHDSPPDCVPLAPHLTNIHHNNIEPHSGGGFP